MPKIRPGITLDADLHALATTEAEARGSTLSALIEDALRDRLYWKIVSWWREGEGRPYCHQEAELLPPGAAGPAFMEVQKRLSGTPGLLSVAAVRQGQVPMWTPPITTEEIEEQNREELDAQPN